LLTIIDETRGERNVNYFFTIRGCP